MKPYMKYHINDDLHWQWYESNKNSYHDLIDDALEPFKHVPLGSIVDIGSGDGLALSLLHNLGFKCFGVEPIQKGVDLAMQHNVSAEFFIEQAEKFATRGFEFDYLVSINTIEHMDNPEALLEIMKHIRQFGIIVTDDYSTAGAKPSSYHTVEFTPDSFVELFKDFDAERIPMRAKEFFAYKVSNKKK